MSDVNLKNNVGIIVPYFGELPANFSIWYESALANSDVDFHLVGDCFSEIKTQKNIFV